jgi:hypothetical protein
LSPALCLLNSTFDILLALAPDFLYHFLRCEYRAGGRLAVVGTTTQKNKVGWASAHQFSLFFYRGMKGAKWRKNCLGRYQQPLEILNG